MTAGMSHLQTVIPQDKRGGIMLSILTYILVAVVCAWCAETLAYMKSLYPTGARMPDAQKRFTCASTTA